MEKKRTLFDLSIGPRGGSAEGGGGARQVFKVPIDQIEHGESAMPGGQLTWPQSAQTIRDYAARPTPFPPIELVPPDRPGGRWMVYDGSLRLEAAKLRGDKFIDAINPFPPSTLDNLGN